MQVKLQSRSKLPASFFVPSALHSLLLWFWNTCQLFSQRSFSGSNIGLLSIFINVNTTQFSQVTESPPNYLKSDFKSVNNLWARVSKYWIHWQDRRRQNCERKPYFLFSNKHVHSTDVTVETLPIVLRAVEVTQNSYFSFLSSWR